MAAPKYSEEDLAELEFYAKYGWPDLLNKHQLALYTGMSETFISSVWCRSVDPEFPVMPLTRGWIISREAYAKFRDEVAFRGIRLEQR